MENLEASEMYTKLLTNRSSQRHREWRCGIYRTSTSVAMGLPEVNRPKHHHRWFFYPCLVKDVKDRKNDHVVSKRHERVLQLLSKGVNRPKYRERWFLYAWRFFAFGNLWQVEDNTLFTALNHWPRSYRSQPAVSRLGIVLQSYWYTQFKISNKSKMTSWHLQNILKCWQRLSTGAVRLKQRLHGQLKDW